MAFVDDVRRAGQRVTDGCLGPVGQQAGLVGAEAEQGDDLFDGGGSVEVAAEDVLVAGRSAFVAEVVVVRDPLL
ncbi:hypothetical protein [Actinoplanes sp. HUAS TT8]|uniref:hypothetical protein n=1 Tax=Actinoplanes sp. HUAS TT8 TaxID=3447453 RepID=UPI003F51B9C8